MLYKSIAIVAAAAAGVAAQAPNGTSICDYYTTALLMNNTAANQQLVLTLLVNTVVIGNYTQPNVGVAVPGILAAGKYNGTDVNLAPFFSGGLASTNRGGKTGVSVNFLDGGGAVPLMNNTASNDPNSNQEKLLTHLYEFFGALLGCTMQGGDFPAYAGEASMYNVHKFMDLSAAEVGYFITQVGLAAASFGVADSDVTAVGMALQTTFGFACAPEAAVIPAQGPQLQSICIDSTCPQSPNATCASYAAAVEPTMVNGTSTASGSSPSGTAAASGAASGTSAGSKPSGTAASGSAAPSASGKSGASTVAFSLTAVFAAGVAALLL